MQRTRHFVALFCLAILGIISLPARAQNSKGNWITGRLADELWDKLGSAPYARNGEKGMVLYMLTYSSCPNCLNFLNSFYLPKRNQIQLREIFAPLVDPRFANECADVALTRDPAVVDAYYRHTRSAPAVSSAPERARALQQVELLFGFVNSAFAKIGHLQGGFPTFIFKTHDQVKLWIVSGFGPEFARDLDAEVQEYAQYRLTQKRRRGNRAGLQKRMQDVFWSNLDRVPDDSTALHRGVYQSGQAIRSRRTNTNTNRSGRDQDCHCGGSG